VLIRKLFAGFLILVVQLLWKIAQLHRLAHIPAIKSSSIDMQLIAPEKNSPLHFATPLAVREYIGCSELRIAVHCLKTVLADFWQATDRFWLPTCQKPVLFCLNKRLLACKI